MADATIDELSALTTPATDDELAIYDVTEGSDYTKKITVANLTKATTSTTTDIDGFVVGDGSNLAASTVLTESGGDLTATGDLSVVDVTSSGYVRQANVWHAFGGFQGADETIALDADTWTHMTNATNDLWTGLEADGITLSGDIMTFTNGGDYMGSLSITFEGANNKDFLFRVYNTVQNAAMGYYAGATGLGANNLVNVSIPLYLEVNASDTLRMEVKDVTDGTDITVHEAIFYVSYLHD